MYHGNIFPADLHYSLESVPLQVHRAWDGSYFEVPGNSILNNTEQINSAAISSTSDTEKKSDRNILQNIGNYPLPSNQFIPVEANIYSPSVPQSIPSPTDQLQFYQSIFTEASRSLDNQPFSCSSNNKSVTSHIDNKITSTTNTFELNPVSQHRAVDCFPVFDAQLPFETLMVNLQDLLSNDQFGAKGPDTVTQTTLHSKELIVRSGSSKHMEVQDTPTISVQNTFHMPATSPQRPVLTDKMSNRPQAHSVLTISNKMSSTTDTKIAGHPSGQIGVAAHEHRLKIKFSQVAKQNPQKVKELSQFLQCQSAMIESQRLQQLTEAAYPHYKEWLNAQYDTELHQLMDRVEISLQLIDTCGKENKNQEKSRKKIPENVSQVFETWYHVNVHHPYPTAEQCQNLADCTGLRVQQVRKWFSNKRCRSKILQKQQLKKQ